MGERIAIGELAKFGIDIMLPMTDNLPFDFVIFYKNKFFKCQVKSSFKKAKHSQGSIFFDLTSNNWYSKTTKSYSQEEVDIFILCDGNSIYLFKYDELINKQSITIRMDTPNNNQNKNINYANLFIISNDRLNHIFS